MSEAPEAELLESADAQAALPARRWGVMMGDGTKLYLYAASAEAARQAMVAKQQAGETIRRRGAEQVLLSALGHIHHVTEEPLARAAVAVDERKAPGA